MNPGDCVDDPDLPEPLLSLAVDVGFPHRPVGRECMKQRRSRQAARLRRSSPTSRRDRMAIHSCPSR